MGNCSDCDIHRLVRNKALGHVDNYIFGSWYEREYNSPHGLVRLSRLRKKYPVILPFLSFAQKPDTTPVSK